MRAVSVRNRSVTNLVCQGPGDLGIRPGCRVGQTFSMGSNLGMGCRQASARMVPQVCANCRSIMGNLRMPLQRGYPDNCDRHGGEDTSRGPLNHAASSPAAAADDATGRRAHHNSNASLYVQA